MVTTSYTNARKHLASLLNRASDDHETVIVTRQDHADVALISADELRGLEETAHLLRSPANATRLLEALHRSVRNDVHPQSVDDLSEAVGLGREMVAKAP